MEKQFNNIEIREFEDNSLKIIARVNDYGLSKELRDRNGRKFREIVPRDTWQRAINSDIKFYYNHKNYFELADEVELRAEEDGVYLYATLKDSEKGLYQAIKDGLITGMSFGFKAIRDSFKNVGNYLQRTIEEMELFEVSILDKEPAYNNTLVEARELTLPKLFDLELEKRKLELYKIK